MSVEQPMTVVIHAHGLVAVKSSNVIMQMLSKKLNFEKVRSIQFVPGGRIRVTFSCLEYRNAILGNKTLQIDDLHHLDVTESDVPVTNVYVHYLPVEAGDVGIRLALRPFGKVVGISHQHFSGFKQITTGTRIVRMCLHQHIPFQCNIQGFPCRVWYTGSRLNAPSVTAPIRRLIALIVTNAKGVISLAILPRTVEMHGVPPLLLGMPLLLLEAPLPTHLPPSMLILPPQLPQLPRLPLPLALLPLSLSR